MSLDHSEGHLAADVPAAARTYIDRGWAPLPIPYKSKAPTIKGWPSLRIGVEEITDHFPAGSSFSLVGFSLVSPQGNLVDIDIDSMLAVRLARFCLPHTDCKLGRIGKPLSHWVCVARAITKTFKDPESGEMLVEIRADGHHTVFPPSIHPSGEAVEFDDDAGLPSPIDTDELLRRTSRVSERPRPHPCSLLARHARIETGTGHGAGGGASARRLGCQKLRRFLMIVGRGCEGRGKCVTRVKAGEYAIVRLDEGKPLYGWPKLGELFGSKVTRSIADWLGLAKPSLEEGAVARSFDDLAAEARALTDKSPPEATSHS